MILQGDCLDQLRTLLDESVDCCITSPPYYGLRDYGMDGQIGLEQTPEAYVSRLVEVFREVKRVLKPEGTLWLNLGDSYCRDPAKGGSGPNGKHDFIPDYGNARKIMSESKGSFDGGVGRADRAPVRVGGNGLKPKDLIGIPWMVAFALRADGWWLRSDIIWANLSMVRPFQSPKPNCMPESVTDRPTKSHEYLFLLSKNKKYYYDAEAIKEATTGNAHGRGNGVHPKTTNPGLGVKANSSFESACRNIVTSRNKRSVWTINSQSFKGAHFATFPEALVEPCILAGTSERGYCPECGKPWVRQVEHKAGTSKKCPATDAYYQAQGGEGEKCSGTVGMSGSGRVDGHTKTIGWLPSCQCASKPRPGIVLDPFSGAGTVALVAKKLGRHYIGIELNPAYVEMAKTRINKIPARLSRWVEDARP